MFESSKSQPLSATQFIEVNHTPVFENPELKLIVEKSLELRESGVLKLTNFFTLTPFVALGGDVDQYRKYYREEHKFDPVDKWSDWEAVLAELQEVFKEHFS